MKIFLLISTLLMFFSIPVFSHKIELDDKTTEEIVNTRMKKMSIINKLTQKIYKHLNSEDFKLLKDETLELKHAAVEFAGLFPENSEAGNAKKIIWEERELFDEYNSNFLNDINSMLADIENKNLSNLKISFNNMASNCGTCHKKFKKKK